MSDALQEIVNLHRPIETTIDSVTDIGGGWQRVDEYGGAVCMTCHGFPPAPCETYRLATGLVDDGGMEVARIVVVRTATEDDLIDTVDATGPGGDDLPLTEALGMLRLAEDTLIRDRTDGEDGAA